MKCVKIAFRPLMPQSCFQLSYTVVLGTPVMPNNFVLIKSGVLVRGPLNAILVLAPKSLIISSLGGVLLNRQPTVLLWLSI